MVNPQGRDSPSVKSTSYGTQICPQNLVNSHTETGDLNQLKYVNLRVLNQLYDTCLDTNLSTESCEFTYGNRLFEPVEIREFTCSEPVI